MATADVLSEILRLPAEERARLVLELLRSLDGEPDADAAVAWEAEIERRGAEVDAGTAETMTLEDYRAHVRALLVAAMKPRPTIPLELSGTGSEQPKLPRQPPGALTSRDTGRPNAAALHHTGSGDAAPLVVFSGRGRANRA